MERPYYLKAFVLFLSIMILGNAKIMAQGEEADSIKQNAYTLMTDYYKKNFYPFVKGNAYVGFGFSLVDKDQKNDQGLFIKTLDGKDLSLSITLKGGYFISNYSMVGANVIYDRDEFVGQVILENDTINRNSVSRLATITPVIKSYFPLTKDHRLSFFNELGFGFGFGKTVSRDTKNIDEITKVNSEEFVFSIGLSPGINFFAIENFSFEIQLNNLIGYTYKQSNQTTNETEESKVTTNNVNFNIDLLSLRIGLAYYFGTKQTRK